MRIIAVSDSHGNRRLLREAVEQAMRNGRVDVFLHCGDGVRDVESVAPILREQNADVCIHSVRGNCDIGTFDYPPLTLFEAGGIRMLLTHGDQYHVKGGLGSLADKARSLDAQIAFFGHTHKSLLQPAAGVYLINPGSIAYHSAGGIAYAQVVTEASGKFRADLYCWIT